MGCLALLILAFLFRGPILAVLSALLAVILKLGAFGIVLLAIFLIVAAMAD